MTTAPGRGRAEDAPTIARTSWWCLHPGRLTRSLATGFHRFLTRFSGRRRPKQNYRIYPPPWSFLVVVLVSSLISIVDACSSRTIPKPRPPPQEPTPRPDITFPSYECDPLFAAAYCLNEGVCFMERIGKNSLLNCRCADDYMGPRCEFKYLDGTYLLYQGRYTLEKASLAGGAAVALFLVITVCVGAFLQWRKRKKRKLNEENKPPVGNDVSPLIKVLWIKEECLRNNILECKRTENLRTISGGIESSLKQCGEMLSPDHLSAEKRDYFLGQAVLKFGLK